MVCLLVVVSILSGMLRNAVSARRQLHAERDRRQTELLLEAGLDRAAAALRRSAEYDGETWDIPAKEILGRGDGQVVIEMVAGEAAGGRQIRVAAEYPAGSEVSVRRTRTFIVQLEPTQNEE